MPAEHLKTAQKFKSLDELMKKSDYYKNSQHQKRAREISEALYGTRSIHPAAA